MMSLHVPSATFSVSCRLVLAMVLVLATSAAFAQSTTLATSNEDYTQTPVHSNIESFSLEIELDVPLVAGMRYENPPIRRMEYRVVGQLEEGTPSGFDSFDLQRRFEGDAFYLQGSTLVFTILPAAVLDDGVQVAELAGEAVVFLFDGREIGTGRFHPARLELRGDGTGLLQNSNNQPGEDASSTIIAGAEYIVDLAFDPGNTTVLRITPSGGGSSSGGATLLAIALVPWLLAQCRRRRLRFLFVTQTCGSS